ncbi:glycosyltransferase family 87 protein [Catelliglobosispora koreensis]|uniref:glycosyltransferase family 87 protein n=1 Tax=Catelliglobosispora koreensis TaxID=129052 RepID=UPI0012FA42FE|nr:glycosyltransferase 87 family protein [Catelliglobosispora koreensis]
MSDHRHVLAPSREDPFVSGLSQAVGGPRGQHSVPEKPSRHSGKVMTAARIILALTCAMLMAHWVQKSPCQDGAWVNLSQYTNFCYTDVLALYYAEGLVDGKIPYVPETPVPDEHQVEYPVLTGVFMGLLGLPVNALGEQIQINEGQWFYNLNALVLSAFAVATVAMLISLRRRRPWDAALFALSPAMFVTATVNWDLLAIVLAIAAIWFWAKRRPWLAGLFFGLGTSAKLWPLFLLGPLLLLAIRKNELSDRAFAARDRVVTSFRERDIPELLASSAQFVWHAFHGSSLARATKAFTATAVTWLVINVPVMLISMKDWLKFWDLSETRPIDWGTSFYIGRFIDGEFLGGIWGQFWNDVDAINTWSRVLFVVSCLAIGALIFTAPVPPRLGQVAFLVVAIFLVTSKVWSQQFNLWLLPLLVLARPKWGAFLVWQVAEVCYFLAFYGELMGASGSPVFPEKVFIFASLFRLATVIMLIALVVREIRRPELDVVRAVYRGDPDDGDRELPSEASEPASIVRIGRQPWLTPAGTKG